MDPLSITAAVIGIAAPAAHCIHLLLGDLQKIVDAPETVASLKRDLLSVSQALTSLQAVSDQQWKLLGETVISQSKTATTSCNTSCDRFRASLGHWTRHSEDGRLSLRDRAMVGFIKQGYVKSLSEQLQHCKLTLTSVVSIATLHSSLQHTQATGEIMAAVSQKEAEITDSITRTEKQLAEVNAKLGALCMAKQEEDETEADRASAISQVAVEQTLLGESRKLLEELLSGIKTAAANTRKDQAQVVSNFGSQNQGIQTSVNYGGISGITFGKQ
ncbi:hypothetical protein QBC35DRAFT_500653 [Podospora australis]|uniref:Azaphilone pigments biosynthesis cluster protein L N-terminal domain-containing protein n=1 Tax=Podospora australis TaxID=1536484 RepID=A0AAN6WRD1_9PEZI|nr:hypothetical protein QBC35DRAFT_500653 [Podospora australis]